MARLLSSIVISAVAMTLLATPSAACAGPGERWSAVSTTALAITGDVTFSPSRITFANRAHVEIAFVATLHRADWAGSPSAGAPIALYRILGNRDPMLANRNRLCGSLPRFASVVRKRERSTSPQSDDVTLAIFTKDPVPAGRSESGLCATYLYSARAVGF